MALQALEIIKSVNGHKKIDFSLKIPSMYSPKIPSLTSNRCPLQVAKIWCTYRQ